MPHAAEHNEPARALGAAEADDLAETLKALASPSRLRLLTDLLGRERTVEELARAAGLSDSATSHHLRLLRSLRLVRARRSGRNVYYSLHDHHIADLLAAVRHHHEHVHPPAAVELPEIGGGSQVSGHAHAHDQGHGQGHSHGLVDESIKRSREGLRAVGLALVILTLTAVVQAVIFAASGSVALLADLIHNAGDAATAIPLGIAFALRSARAERWAGLAVVAAIFVSACVAGYEAIVRLIDPRDVEHLGALAAAGVVGFAGNWIAAIVRTRAGRRLDSPALVADGAHARADAYVSLAVIASAAVVALGLPIADPLIGLAITLVILRITWQSWQTVRERPLARLTGQDAGGVTRSVQVAPPSVDCLTVPSSSTA